MDKNCNFSEKSLFSEAFNLGRVNALMGILKLNDEEAYNHSIDVAKITALYLEKEHRDFPQKRTLEEAVLITRGALLHDIGKAFLPFNLQHSQRKLSNIEREILKTHTILGVASVRNSEFEEIITNIILMHHASADGKGYPIINDEPFSLANTPDYVWIVAYSDRFDAMVSERAYKKSTFSLKDAWSMLAADSKNGTLPYEFAPIFKEIVYEMDIFKIPEGYTNDFMPEKNKEELE